MYSPSGEGIYSSGFSRATYDAMPHQAESFIRNSRSVVVDATFRHSDERLRWIAMAEACGTEAWVVELVLGDATVKERLEQRALSGDSASGALWEQYQLQKREWEPALDVRAGMSRLTPTGH